MARDSETGEEYVTPGLNFTVTNEGKRPLSIEAYTCAFITDMAKPEGAARSLTTTFSAIVLGHGEAHSACVELPGHSSRFISASARDTTGEEWPASKSERARLRDEERNIWPPKKHKSN
jgi:hypothetical protein